MKVPTRDRPRTLVLASRSARRRLLLKEHAIRHEARDSGLDDGELRPGGVPPREWVVALAYLKARAAADSLQDGDDLVLGADTVCVNAGRILGQPRDASEAREMIRSMENRDHEVITGVALIETGRRRRHLFVDGSVVRVGSIGDLDTYLASGDWKGKAGGYNLSERLDAGWPIEYEGDPTTVMGLPMEILSGVLEGLEGGA